MGKKKRQEKAAKKAARLHDQSEPHQAPIVIVGRDDLVTTTIRYPRYVQRLLDRWLLAHPGHTKTSLIMNGLRAIGLPIADEELVPRRPRDHYVEHLAPQGDVTQTL